MRALLKFRLLPTNGQILRSPLKDLDISEKIYIYIFILILHTSVKILDLHLMI